MAARTDLITITQYYHEKKPDWIVRGDDWFSWLAERRRVNASDDQIKAELRAKFEEALEFGMTVVPPR